MVKRTCFVSYYGDAEYLSRSANSHSSCPDCVAECTVAAVVAVVAAYFPVNASTQNAFDHDVVVACA